MHENFEEDQEGGAESTACGREWRVPFCQRGVLVIRAETPREAAEKVEWLSPEELACAATEVSVEAVKEVRA